MNYRFLSSSGSAVAKKDAEESAKEKQEIEQAARDLSEFESDQARKREQSFAANRQREQEKLEEMASKETTSMEKPWDRVCSMVDMSPKDGEGTARMRTILIEKKNEELEGTA